MKKLKQKLIIWLLSKLEPIDVSENNIQNDFLTNSGYGIYWARDKRTNKILVRMLTAHVQWLSANMLFLPKSKLTTKSREDIELKVRNLIIQRDRCKSDINKKNLTSKIEILVWVLKPTVDLYPDIDTNDTWPTV